MEYNWTFSIEDLEKIEEYYSKKKEEVEKFRKYSKPQGKILSDYEKIKKIIKFIELLKEKKLDNKLIDILNNEELKEKSVIDLLLDDFEEFKNKINYYKLGKILYSANKYFLKVRVSLNYLKFRKKKIDELCFLPIIIQKLIANKFTEKFRKREIDELCFLPIIIQKLIANKFTENKIVEKPNRNKVIGKLIGFLRKLENLEKFQVIRADFKSYTLNIIREKVFEILKNENIPQNIINLIKDFIQDSTIEVRMFKNYNFEKLFEEIGYKKNYESDSDFKSIIGYEGILPGTPLTNILGQLYLKEFDKKMEELAGNEGFYSRYFDDLILIIPKEKELKEVREEISSYLNDFYKIKKEKIQEILQMDKIELRPNSSFEFLGYQFKVENKSLKISVRYKTIRKFIYKFIYEYKPKESKNLKNLIKCLVAKNYYLFSWLYSFKYINDQKLLEKIYLYLILPNIYLTLKKFKIEKKFHDIKKFYRPNTILRIVRNVESDKEKLYKKIEGIRKNLSNLLSL